MVSIQVHDDEEMTLAMMNDERMTTSRHLDNGSKRAQVDLQEHFANLPLILAQKERINPSFRRYTADVAYDFRVYRQFFDQVDRKLTGEPEPVREAAAAALLETRGREFMAFFDQTLGALEDEVKGFSREEHERHGYYFRKQVADLIQASEFLSLTNAKPRGYLGDPDMMAILYENGYRGGSTFAKLMHKHPIETSAAQAVRNRRAYIKQLLLDAERSSPRPLPEGFRFLSVASGAAYEARDLFTETEGAFSRFSCTLLDQDETALGDALRAIAGIKRKWRDGHPGVRADEPPLSRSSICLGEFVRSAGYCRETWS
jgi:extracellular factor (EF) 3-hydroxypalmitic acid methyl ester biosynthesis protein